MANRIGLRQLRAFHAVMVTGSIGAAAERLNLTQPAISKQLSGLEHALDIRLFNRRSGRATTPTQEGVDYYKAIETTIAGLEDLAPIARTIRAGGRKRIRFAATPPVMNSARLLAGHTAILPSRQTLRSRIDAELERSGAVVTAELECSSALTCCRMAAAGLGVPVCDAFSPTAFSPADLATRG